MDDGGVMGAYDKVVAALAGERADQGRPAIWSRSDAWDEAAIPHRPWLASGYFLRGAVTTLIGPGGVSKSSLVLAWVVALGMGEELGAMRPRDRFRSAVYNVEDDDAEQRRRLSAALTSMGRTPADIAGWVLRTGPKKGGALFHRDPVTGLVSPTSAMAELEAGLEAFGADILFVDPLAELHGVEENDNTGMRAIVAEFRALAVRLNIAVVLVHHTRKGQHAPGDADAGRGASSIISASRVALTITSMTEDEAKAFGLAAGSHKHFFRLDGGKANYSALTDCEWFERRVYALANDDLVAVTVPWQPPADAVSLDTRLAIEAAVEAGSSLGPWSIKLSGDARSIKHVLTKHGVATAIGQKSAIAALMDAGFVVSEFRRADNRVIAQGLRAPDGRPSNTQWISCEAPP